MKIGMFIATLIVTLLLVGTLPLINSSESSVFIFQSPLFIGFVFLCLLISLIALFRHPTAKKNPFLWITHLAMVVIVVGSIISWQTREESIPFALSHKIPNYYISQIRLNLSEQEMMQRQVNNQSPDIESLGASIQCTDFKVERYDPEYQLIEITQPLPQTNTTRPQEKIIATLDFKNNQLQAHPRIPSSFSPTQLKNGDQWLPYLELEKNLFLLRNEKDKQYLATIKITPHNLSPSDSDPTVTISANAPLFLNGWRIALTDYNADQVFFIASRDAGRQWVISGLLILLASLFINSFHALKRVLKTFSVLNKAAEVTNHE